MDTYDYFTRETITILGCGINTEHLSWDACGIIYDAFPEIIWC